MLYGDFLKKLFKLPQEDSRQKQVGGEQVCLRFILRGVVVVPKAYMPNLMRQCKRTARGGRLPVVKHKRR